MMVALGDTTVIFLESIKTDFAIILLMPSFACGDCGIMAVIVLFLDRFLLL